MAKDHFQSILTRAGGRQMSHSHERRREKRIRFSWPLWFGFEQYGQLHQGKIADLSRSGVSFFIREDQSPRVGQHVLTRFTYPCDTSDRFEIVIITGPKLSGLMTTRPDNAGWRCVCMSACRMNPTKRRRRNIRCNRRNRSSFCSFSILAYYSRGIWEGSVCRAG